MNPIVFPPVQVCFEGKSRSSQISPRHYNGQGVSRQVIDNVFSVTICSDNVRMDLRVELFTEKDLIRRCLIRLTKA